VAEELRGAAVPYVFDLSGDRSRLFQFFPEAIAAFAIPAALEERLSLLVWGAVLPTPENEPAFCALLPEAVRKEMPTALYLSGWGTLTFNGVRSGDVTVWPYEPTLQLNDLKMIETPEGKPAMLTRSWTSPDTSPCTEHLLSIVLEQPLGFMALKLQATGPVTFAVDPGDFVTEQQLEAFPQRYRYDITRRRQLVS
jgi:hypothetical protein